MGDEPRESVAATAEKAAADPLPDEPTSAERVTADPVAAAGDPGYTPGGVPTFDSVREKIETRYGSSLGAAELDAETPEGRSIEEQYEARQKAAAERVAEIRKSMHNHDEKP